jgi:hypothetical protein
MNHETLGKHTLGQLISLYRGSQERCKQIVEILEEIQDVQDSLRLAKEDVRLAENDGDDPADIEEFKNKVKVYENDLDYVIRTNIDGLQARVRNLAEDASHGAEKIDG